MRHDEYTNPLAPLYEPGPREPRTEALRRAKAEAERMRGETLARGARRLGGLAAGALGRLADGLRARAPR